VAAEVDVQMDLEGFALRVTPRQTEAQKKRERDTSLLVLRKLTFFHHQSLLLTSNQNQTLQVTPAASNHMCHFQMQIRQTCQRKFMHPVCL
jgi:hypothetical protein